MGRFEGQVVLVTGGNRNTGLWLVRKFAEEGARVFTCARNAKSAAKAMGAGCSCQHMPVDVDR